MAFNRGRIMYVTPISKGSKKKKKKKKSKDLFKLI